MTWFSFQGGYGTIDFTGANEKGAVALGFHGYATEALAKAHPNSVNPLQAPELTILIDHQAGALPGGPPGSAVPPNATAKSDLGTSLGALLDIPKYIAASTLWLGNRGNWLRILKVIAGGALILMGAHQLTVVKNGINTAKQVGKKAAEVAGAAALG